MERMIGCLLGQRAVWAAPLAALVRDATGSARAVAAGLVLGLGVGAMHAVGMASLQVTGVLVWSRPLLLAAPMSMILAFAALALFAERMRRANIALRASESAHRLSEERLALAIDGDGLWDLALADGAMWLSPSWQSMLGYEPGELESHRRTWERLVHPEDKEQALRVLTAHLAGHAALYESEHRMLRKDGRWTWVLVRGKVVARDAGGRAIRMVGLQSDTTTRRAADRRIAHMALHDPLTDLPNRTLLRERLEQLVLRTRRQGGRFAVLVCDLDRFKAVNDTHGHPAGDALLGVIAGRLRAVVRTDDTVARVGGDEFVILLSHLDTRRSAARVAERLIAAVARPVDIGPASVRVGISIGIAIGDGNEASDALVKSADTALYRAKIEGRNAYRFFEAPHPAAV